MSYHVVLSPEMSKAWSRSSHMCSPQPPALHSFRIGIRSARMSSHVVLSPAIKREGARQPHFWLYVLHRVVWSRSSSREVRRSLLSPLCPFDDGGETPPFGGQQIGALLQHRLKGRGWCALWFRTIKPGRARCSIITSVREAETAKLPRQVGSIVFGVNYSTIATFALRVIARLPGAPS